MLPGVAETDEAKAQRSRNAHPERKFCNVDVHSSDVRPTAEEPCMAGRRKKNLAGHPLSIV